MSEEYYIRSPEHEESRGPFTTAKLQTLAEAGQVSENTLIYDDSREEWVPLGKLEALRASVFPERQKLSLKPRKSADTTEGSATGQGASGDDEAGGHDISEMLAAAEGDTDETRHLKKRERSFQKAVALAASGIGLMMVFSAVFLLMPHFGILNTLMEEERSLAIVNHPFVLVGLFDLFMAVFLFLAVTEVYPLLRARGMLTVGFGVYLGWALGDTVLMVSAAAAGLGIFAATLARSYPVMLLALCLGIGGNGWLAYLSLTGRFTGFFEGIEFELVSPE